MKPYTHHSKWQIAPPENWRGCQQVNWFYGTRNKPILLSFHTYQLDFCICNFLRLNAAIFLHFSSFFWPLCSSSFLDQFSEFFPSWSISSINSTFWENFIIHTSCTHTIHVIKAIWKCEKQWNSNQQSLEFVLTLYFYTQ